MLLGQKEPVRVEVAPGIMVHIHFHPLHLMGNHQVKAPRPDHTWSGGGFSGREWAFTVNHLGSGGS